MIAVEVKAGLSFACPYCLTMGHRAGEGSDVFTLPPGHEEFGRAWANQALIMCYVDREEPATWVVQFVDTEEYRTCKAEMDELLAPRRRGV